MTNVQRLFERWVGVIRLKASLYEHEERKSGVEVVSPSLDDVCNEMKAYLAGIQPDNPDVIS